MKNIFNWFRFCDITWVVTLRQLQVCFWPYIYRQWLLLAFNMCKLWEFFNVLNHCKSQSFRGLANTNCIIESMILHWNWSGSWNCWGLTQLNSYPTGSCLTNPENFLLRPCWFCKRPFCIGYLGRSFIFIFCVLL